MNNFDQNKKLYNFAILILLKVLMSPHTHTHTHAKRKEEEEEEEEFVKGWDNDSEVHVTQFIGLVQSQAEFLKPRYLVMQKMSCRKTFSSIFLCDRIATYEPGALKEEPYP